MTIDKSQEIPAWESQSLKVADQVTKQLSKKSPRIKSRRGEWLSTKQYAERLNISESAATKRLARAFSAKYYQLPKLSLDNSSFVKEDDLFYEHTSKYSNLEVRCVPSSKGTKKYEVLLSSLPDFNPCESKVDESVNDSNAFSDNISSFLEKVKPEIFCDWLTISQYHPHDHKIFDKDVNGEIIGVRDNPVPPLKNKIGGFFLVIEDNGELLHDYRRGDGQDKTEFLLISPKEDIKKQARMYFGCEGSWDSRVFIRVLDGRVDLHGNIGKFGRPDNLFGYSLEDCIKIANDLLAKYDLPPFTGGNFIEPYISAVDDKLVKGWTGATFSRIDLTTNLTFGCPEDAKEYLHWLATQHISRMRNHVHPDGNTVEIGRNDSETSRSNYIQMVAYNKAIEFQKHSEKHLKRMVKKFKKGLIELDLDYTNDYYEKLQNYMFDLGVARLELRLKRDYLHQHENIRYLGALEKDFSQLNEIFYERWASATREFVMKDISQMSAKEQDVYALYLAGVDLKQRYKKSAFYNKRNLLLNYGIDISIPYSGESTAPKIKDMRSLRVRSLPVPEFYYLPKVA